MQDSNPTLKAVLTESIEVILRQIDENESVTVWLKTDLFRAQRVELLAELALLRHLRSRLQWTGDSPTPLRLADCRVNRLPTETLPPQFVLCVGETPVSDLLSHNLLALLKRIRESISIIHRIIATVAGLETGQSDRVGAYGSVAFGLPQAGYLTGTCGSVN